MDQRFYVFMVLHLKIFKFYVFVEPSYIDAVYGGTIVIILAFFGYWILFLLKASSHRKKSSNHYIRIWPHFDNSVLCIDYNVERYKLLLFYFYFHVVKSKGSLTRL